MLALVEPAKVKVDYFDPRFFTTRSINAYVGDRSCNVMRYDATQPIDRILWEVSFNLVEY